MNRRWSILFLLLAMGAAPARESVTPAVQGLIDQLDSTSAARRKEAQEALAQMGSEIRGALLEARENAGPELRQRLQQLLNGLPRSRSDDPPTVKRLLQQFAEANATDQPRILAQLGSVPEGFGIDVMIRLIDEEERDPARWSIVKALLNLPGPKAREKVRQLNLDTINSAKLVLMGWVWVTEDTEKAKALFSRALQSELEQTTADSTQIRQVFDWMYNYALSRKDYDEAARIRRWRMVRDVSTDAEFSDGVFELFALHGEFGPLKGFGKDLASYKAYLNRPEILYSFAMMSQRAGRGMESQLWELQARVGAVQGESRLGVADFLLDRKWNDFAQSELDAVEQEAGEAKGSTLSNLHFRLSRLYGNRGDSQKVGEHLQKGIESRDGNTTLVRVAPNGQTYPWPENDAWAEVHWRFFQAARTRGDMAEIDRRLVELKRVQPTNTDLIIDLVPWLKEKGRKEDATQFFQWAYDADAPQANQDPNNPELQNNLAWLCARCDEKLDEAVKRSEKAVELDQDNAAYIDTLAEVYFRLGRAKEALALEEKALRIRPNDSFMLEQVERFRKGLEKR